MNKAQDFLEKQAFGVCTRLGEKFNIPTVSIRILFIYSSFLTFGSPLIVYLGLAFIMNIRKLLRRRNNPLWYY
ncbi:MAG: PspC domain-containing protein [Cytophagales bacterium]|nr:PspC domain-containing protein [Cytophagales bacterium]